MRFLRGALAVRVFLCFAFGYFLSYAFRSVNAVIAPALRQDVGLSNGDLGLLSAAYFLTFAALQLPVGIWLDKYGPRKTEASLLLFAAAGAAIFAVSSSLWSLWVGRALIGVGVSACLMAAFKAYRQWFAPERQSQLASLMLMSGTSGALSATVPVSAALPVIGWRGVFWVMAAMIVVAAAAIFFLLRKVEQVYADQAANDDLEAGPPQGYRHIFSNPYFRRVTLLAIFFGGSSIALQTLWVGPWMMTVLGMSKEEAARALFVFNLCLMLSYLGLSWWAPRFVSHGGRRGISTTRVIGLGLICMLMVQLAIILSSGPWSWLLWLAFTLFIPTSTLVQTSISLSFPASLAGRANSAYNLLLFIGAFIVQWGIGLLIDAFVSRGVAVDDAMRAALGLCLACQAVAGLVFILNRAQPVTV